MAHPSTLIIYGQHHIRPLKKLCVLNVLIAYQLPIFMKFHRTSMVQLMKVKVKFAQ